MQQTQKAGRLPAAPSSSDVKQRMSTIDAVKKQLAAQPKVRLRVPVDTVVYKNGYGVQIQAKTWVEVPESIAEILEHGDRI